MKRRLPKSRRESADMRAAFQAQQATWRAGLRLAGDADLAERTAAEALEIARRQESEDRKPGLCARSRRSPLAERAPAMPPLVTARP
jgi:hypothetical protein